MDDRSRESIFQRALPIYYALLMAIATVFGIYVLLRLQHVLLILFISLLFAAALARPAEYLAKFYIPRALAVILIYIVVLGLVTALGWYLVPPVLTQIGELSTELPTYADRFQGAQERYEELRREYPRLESLDEELTGIGERITTRVGEELIGLPLTLFGLFFDALSVFFISIMIVTNRERLLSLTLSLIHPDHRETSEVVLRKMWNRLGAYLRAKLIVMTIIGVLTFAVLYYMGVPFALLIALFVAIVEAIPRIGPWIGRVPLAVFAALQGTDVLIIVMLSSLVIQNAKGYFISPFIEGSQLDIHPLLVFISVLVGGALLGIPGAFVAVPAAALIQVFFEEVIIPWRLQQLEVAAKQGGDAPDALPAPE